MRAAVLALATALLTAGPLAASDASAGVQGTPRALAARSLNVTDTARLRYRGTSGSSLMVRTITLAPALARATRAGRVGSAPST